METLLGLMIGVSLAAACGFRVFVPLLVMSIAAASGHLHLAEGFEWIASPVAVTAFAAGTICEVLAYYIPVVDHALDTLAVPAAVVAGTMVTAACIGDMSPFLTWSVATIAGGGAAATVQGLTSVTRLASTATTGGLGNPVIATGEAAGSVLLAGLSVFAPVLAIGLVALLVFLTIRAALSWRRRKADERLMRGQSMRHTAGQLRPAVIDIPAERVHAERI